MVAAPFCHPEGQTSPIVATCWKAYIIMFMYLKDSEVFINVSAN